MNVHNLKMPLILLGAVSFLATLSLGSSDDTNFDIRDDEPAQTEGFSDSTQVDAVSFLPIIDAQNAKAKHEQDLARAKDQKISSWKKRSLKDYQQNLKHKIDSHKLRAEKREVLKQQFGDEYQYNLANDITKCSTRLIEKHYAGIASFIQGSGYLKDLQEIFNKPVVITRELESLFQHCEDSLTIYKNDKKAGKIRREKIYTQTQKLELDQFLGEIFADEPEAIELLSQAYSSDLKCHNPKGLTFGLAFGLGGYAGAYRQKCTTPLGRRYKIYKTHGGVNWGAGGVASTSLAGCPCRPPRVQANSRNYKVTFDHSCAAALALGAGVDITVPGGIIKKAIQSDEAASKNSSEVSTFISPSVGLGIYFGIFGLGGESKKEIEPDFQQLYQALGIVGR